MNFYISCTNGADMGINSAVLTHMFSFVVMPVFGICDFFCWVQNVRYRPATGTTAEAFCSIKGWPAVGFRRAKVL